MRGFRHVPVRALFDANLNQLSSFARDCYWSGLAAQDDRHCLPEDVALLRSQIFPGRPFVSLKDLALARDKLVAIGAWVRKLGPRRTWLEIHPDYRHVDGTKETTFGDRQAETSQEEFPLGPMAVVVPPSGRRPQKINGSIRVEEEEKEIKERKNAREGVAVPAMEEVLAHAASLAPPAREDFARCWWSDMEGSGWIDRNHRPVHPKRWKHVFNAAWWNSQHHETERRNRYGNNKPTRRTEADRVRDQRGYEPTAGQRVQRL